ncbi:MAG: SUMF1/EgtB/PvdO family nonheme iron enzyme, partial [Verrucomicrobia bacterium]|nr:SUMF1/EgtB/PvdO family nonheme iron enzyme [Verrucomicrobiota bacterium]
AQEFCRWLTQKERASGAIGPRQRYRLPTDREWSIAAGLPDESGATPAERDKKIKDVYPWGTQWPPPPRAGNYGDSHWKDATELKAYDDGYQFSAPVGSYRPNAHGLYDLSGNIYEWCEDTEYKAGDNQRVMRGAGFNSRTKAMLLSSNRIHFDAGDRSANHGFRCVLEFDLPAK